MIETFTALLLAHVCADFLLQNKWMAEGKPAFLPLATHIALTGAATALALGALTHLVLFITALHLLIDLVKSGFGDHRLGHFLTDQAAHLGSLALGALLWPLTFSEGLWAGTPYLPQSMAVLAGFLLATRAGQFVVGKLMAPHMDALHEEDGLENGGATIGLLERALTFLLVFTGQPAGVGLLMAAKSFLRVGTANESRVMAEYVIIGTLASLAWALVTSYLTLELLEMLAPAP